MSKRKHTTAQFQDASFARLYARITDQPEPGQDRNTTPIVLPAVRGTTDIRNTVHINSVPQQVVSFTPTLGGGAVGGAPLNAKDNQSWMYPQGKIQRLDSVNVNGRLYTDPKGRSSVFKGYTEGGKIEPHMELAGLDPRRKHESNFMVTINTNREYINRVGDDGVTYDDDFNARHLYYVAMRHITSQEVFLRCLKFGPKHAHYKNDRPIDVIVPGIKPSGSVEVGERQHRMHCHIIFSIEHYSQIQIDPRMLTAEFKKAWNDECKDKGLDHLMVTKPYVQVKLQPQSDAANIMRRYAEKAMMTFDY